MLLMLLVSFLTSFVHVGVLDIHVSFRSNGLYLICEDCKNIFTFIFLIISSCDEFIH